MEKKTYYIELLDIIDLIHANRADKWPIILKKIAKIFSADEAFFASIEDNSIMCKSSLNNINNYQNTEEETVLNKTIRYKKTISISNYNKFSSRSVYWIQKGLKSILSVPIFFKDDVFGALQIAYFKKYTFFSENTILLLEKIAKIISLILNNDSNTERYNKTINMEIAQIELIYKNKIPKTYKDKEFTQWIINYLNKILAMTQAKAVGFVFPKEDIYVAVSSKNAITFVAYSKTTEVRNLITYKIWEKQINDVLLLDDLSKFDINISNFAKTSRIKSALFVPIVINNEVIAVFAFGFNKLNKVTKDYRIFLQTIAMHIMFAMETSKNLSNVNSILTETEEKFTESFVLMMEARDAYTKGHSQRVAFYSKKIAQALGLNEDKQSLLYIAGIVHDIGKIGIPDAVLLKPGKLTEEEYKIMQYHSEFSYQIIKGINRFKKVADCVRHHHERCDGSGYPNGLDISAIPIGSKILAIADVFDAITTDRPYRKALNLKEAIETISSMKTKFDEDILKKAVRVLEDNFIFDNTYEPYRNFMPKHIDKIRMEIFTKDFMTGLLRRKTFIEKVEVIINTNKRFSMFYVDIKDLSRINYKYSMGVGDKVILSTAETLKKTEHISFLARTQPDVFYFLYLGKLQSELFGIKLKKALKKRVIQNLSNIEMELNVWEKIIDFYISFSEFVPGKSAEDMMYECQRRKREMEEMIYE